ncbi:MULTISPECIES: hypothetical protein [Bradyrhizobium]|uniref:Uncharacterized protein n=1 Tax=Bradyrhizobium frederickii TaxID=2560054 RepID=A0A4Y9KNY4_9BRAD|nr:MULTISPECIES: hypothetical protein [Bradyrhizobium]TFV28667.1 hypothetical protein E4K66_38615 [Bradyrhizobium frederickii]
MTNGEVAIDQNCGFPDVLLGRPAADDSYDVACCSAKGTNENACRHWRELHEADPHLAVRAFGSGSGSGVVEILGANTTTIKRAIGNNSPILRQTHGAQPAR